MLSLMLAAYLGARWRQSATSIAHSSSTGSLPRGTGGEWASRTSLVLSIALKFALMIALTGALTLCSPAQLLAQSMPQFMAQRMPNLGHRAPARIARRGGSIATPNFVIYAPDRSLAQKVAQEAERYRKELAIEWLGSELPRWNEKCPIYVSIGPDAGGETSFQFEMSGMRAGGKGMPIAWEMKIFGPPDRLLDAVLPHEITHTIFATHFGRPLPRWADEGACTTVEHESERNKNHQMLIRFLTASPSRGIPFNRMFTMKNYPDDILPLYAQGYSLAKFLIFQKGRRHFLDFVSRGLANEQRQDTLAAWDSAAQEFYEFTDLSDLQVAWLKWVKSGSRQELVSKFSRLNLDATPGKSQPATVQIATRPQPPVASTYTRAPLVNRDIDEVGESRFRSNGNRVVSALARNPSWYEEQMQKNRSSEPTPSFRPRFERKEVPASGTIWR